MSKIRFVLLAFVATFSLTSFADFNPTIVITSFQRMGATDTKLAELCGAVQENNNNEFHLHVLVDPTSINPHSYHIITGTDGKFCTIVATLSGLARVSLMNALDDGGVGARIQ